MAGASTWWGRAWIEALEGVAGGDTARLGRGRTYARQGRAEDLVVQPGAVSATVVGSRSDPYDTHLAIRELRDDEWDAVFEAIAGRAAHAAALLDGELDPAVVEDARAVEVELLPRPRDLRSACTCPDEAEPCKHAAALCYLMVDAIDADPFVLFLLRGRTRDQVLAGVRARRPEAAPVPVAAPTADPWDRTPGPLPAVPSVVDRPGRGAAWPTEPPSIAPFDGAGLRALVADAARRAWDLCAGGTESSLHLDERTDLARRAAGAPPAELARMADRAGVAPVDLEVLGQAWSAGGVDAVRAHDEPRWTPPPLVMAGARDLIEASGFSDRRVHVSGNRIMVDGRLQFRRSRDGRWYLYSKASGRWLLAAPPEEELEDLVLLDLRDTTR